MYKERAIKNIEDLVEKGIITSSSSKRFLLDIEKDMSNQNRDIEIVDIPQIKKENRLLKLWRLA